MTRIFLNNADDTDAADPGRVRMINLPHSQDTIVITRVGYLDGIGYRLEVRNRVVEGTTVKWEQTSLPSISVSPDRHGRPYVNMSSANLGAGDFNQLGLVMDVVAEIVNELENA